MVPDAAIRALAGELLAAARRRPGPAERLLAWSLADPALQRAGFRLVDALPALDGHRAVARALHDHLGPHAARLPWPAAPLLARLGRPDPLDRPAALLARGATRLLARRFIAGADPRQAAAAVGRLRAAGLAATIDHLGEAVLTPAEADAYRDACLALLETQAAAATAWRPDPRLDADPDGTPVPRVNLSLKLTALAARGDAWDPEGFAAAVAPRLRPILRRARALGAFVNIDMEHHQAKDLVLGTVRRVLLEDEFRTWTQVGVAIQAYLRSVAEDLADLARWADGRGAPVWVRLVKGAYCDQERAWAALRSWEPPVWPDKAATDAAYERAGAWLIAHRHRLRPAFASHNVRSLAAAIRQAEAAGLPAGWVEIQMLHGMAGPLAAALTARGHRVRIYAPVGDLLGGMAYLVRRLLENTANDGFVRALVLDRRDGEDLLMDPATRPPVPPAPPPAGFRNHPLLDPGRSGVREAAAAAVAQAAAGMPLAVPLVIAGSARPAGPLADVHPPAHPGRILGRVHQAGAADADAAVAAARAAQPAWEALGWDGRADRLEAVAGALATARLELAALMVHEVGKAFREADAEVCEAIDFCRFYAAAARRLGMGRDRDLAGERNRLRYGGRGVAAVIGPWNFPLAIPAGMAMAALAAGNTAILKPAEQSPLIAARFHALAAPHLTPGALACLPGAGEVVGAALAAHDGVDVVAFTGSRAVGAAIIAAAARPRPRGWQHVVCELGGKNAIIVAADADLDEAVAGVVQSAFGFQGQKCSACSRAIVEAGLHDRFLARLRAAVAALRLGPPEDPGSDLGPVIDRDARDRLLAACARARAAGARQVWPDPDAPPPALPADGWYLAPHLFADADPAGELGQVELFGPVLAVFAARDLEHALALANGTPYALTGGAYARSPAALDRIREGFQVGNLYLNRPITGALVDRQPFGGFRCSGLGTKAGGDDYLLQFCQARVISENTQRHGIAG